MAGISTRWSEPKNQYPAKKHCTCEKPIVSRVDDDEHCVMCGHPVAEQDEE